MIIQKINHLNHPTFQGFVPPHKHWFLLLTEAWSYISLDNTTMRTIWRMMCVYVQPVSNPISKFGADAGASFRLNVSWNGGM